MNIDEIRRLLEHHRQVVRDLEEELSRVERGQESVWVPQKFYTAYYITAGLVIGMVAAWITLLLNMIGSALIFGDAYKLLRVYSTFFAGAEAMETNKAAILMLTVGIHTLTGAICGAPIHVVVSRWRPGTPLLPRLLIGAALGLVMWVVNFFGILSWLQPSLVGEAYILKEIPHSVALANHVAFAMLVLYFQPWGAFAAQRRAAHEQAG